MTAERRGAEGRTVRERRGRVRGGHGGGEGRGRAGDSRTERGRGADGRRAEGTGGGRGRADEGLSRPPDCGAEVRPVRRAEYGRSPASQLVRDELKQAASS